MNTKIFFSGLAAFFASFNAHAWSLGEFVSCNDINPQPAVIFKSSYGKLIHDISQSPEFVNNLGKNSPVIQENGLLTAGVAPITTSTSFHIKKAILKRLDNEYSCIMPEEIEIFIGYKNPLIYVSNKYDTKSCEFSQIIRHEQVHQRINKLTLEYYLPILDKTLRKAIDEVKAVKIRTNDEADKKRGFEELYSYYHSRIDPILNEFKQARDNEQKKLDNLNSYQHDWSICTRYKERVEIEEKLKLYQDETPSSEEK